MTTRGASIGTHVAATRALAAQGLTATEIAEKLGKSPSTINDYAATYGIAIVRTGPTLKKQVPEGTADRIAAWIAQGWSMVMIARELGWQQTFVYDYCKRLGVKLPGQTQARARRVPGSAVGLFKASIPVPKWVHPSLKGEYRDFTADLGEDEAARRIRRLQHEMRGCAA